MQVFNQLNSVVGTAKTAGLLVALAFLLFVGVAVGVALFADDTRGKGYRRNAGGLRPSR